MFQSPFGARGFESGFDKRAGKLVLKHTCFNPLSGLEGLKVAFFQKSFERPQEGEFQSPFGARGFESRAAKASTRCWCSTSFNPLSGLEGLKERSRVTTSLARPDVCFNPLSGLEGLKVINEFGKNIANVDVSIPFRG